MLSVTGFLGRTIDDHNKEVMTSRSKEDDIVSGVSYNGSGDESELQCSDFYHSLWSSLFSGQLLSREWQSRKRR